MYRLIYLHGSSPDFNYLTTKNVISRGVVPGLPLPDQVEDKLRGNDSHVPPIVIPAKLVLDLIGERESRNVAYQSTYPNLLRVT